MDDAVKLPRRRPIETLHPTAQLVQDEIVGTADQALKRELKKHKPAESVQFWRVSWGGMRRLYAKIAAGMINAGLQDTDSEGHEPTERQHQIALTLDSLTRRQRRQTVAMALHGHEGRMSRVLPIKAVKYPEFERSSMQIVETRPYIRVGIRRAMGRAAAAVIVRTNPNHEIVQSPTAGYRSLEDWVAKHPGSPLAPSPVPVPRDLTGHHEYHTAMNVLDGLYAAQPAQVEEVPPSSGPEDTDDLSDQT